MNHIDIYTVLSKLEQWFKTICKIASFRSVNQASNRRNSRRPLNFPELCDFNWNFLNKARGGGGGGGDRQSRSKLEDKLQHQDLKTYLPGGHNTWYKPYIQWKIILYNTHNTCVFCNIHINSVCLTKDRCDLREREAGVL